MTFEGWAVTYGTKCDDGCVFVAGCFETENRKIVPIFYRHQGEQIGIARLASREKGLYAYCDICDGRVAKKVAKGRLKALSIGAEITEFQGNLLMKGTVKEISIVSKGADPNCKIEEVKPCNI